MINLDPNPGNYVCPRSEWDRPWVGFIDFGCCAEIDEKWPQRIAHCG